MRSEVRMVVIRCAIVITVHAANCSRMTFCSISSLLKSMLAVASSTSTTFLGSSSVLAMLMSCRSPPLKLAPPSSTLVARPLRACRLSHRPQRWRAATMSSSLKALSGSMFWVGKGLPRAQFRWRGSAPAESRWTPRAATADRGRKCRPRRWWLPRCGSATSAADSLWWWTCRCPCDPRLRSSLRVGCWGWVPWVHPLTTADSALRTVWSRFIRAKSRLNRLPSENRSHYLALGLTCTLTLAVNQ